MKLLITAGGTSEAIDKVRKITNMSKGSLGKKILHHALANPKIEQIYYLSASDPLDTLEEDCPYVQWVKTESVQDLEDNMKSLLTSKSVDVVIHAMAVSDYTVEGVFTFESLADYLNRELHQTSSFDEATIFALLKQMGHYALDNSSKISSKSTDLAIKLMPTAKVISKIKTWAPGVKLMGFKLLENVTDDELIRIALEQQSKNGCDWVFANDIKRIRESGHQGLLIHSREHIQRLTGLEEIAKTIIAEVTK